MRQRGVKLAVGENLAVEHGIARRARENDVISGAKVQRKIVVAESERAVRVRRGGIHGKVVWKIIKLGNVGRLVAAAAKEVRVRGTGQIQKADGNLKTVLDREIRELQIEGEAERVIARQHSAERMVEIAVRLRGIPGDFDILVRGFQ